MGSRVLIRLSYWDPGAILCFFLLAFLDRGQQIGGQLWSADFPPRRLHIFPPHLLSKNEAEMCRPLHEVAGGVDDLHCSATHSRGVLKPRNS